MDALEAGAAGTAYEHESGPRIERGRLATWLFLAAESLFFGGLLSAWGVLRAQTPDWAEGAGPSLGVGLGMTALLLAASFVGHTASVRARDRRPVAGRLLLAAGLALAFLGAQALEYRGLAAEGHGPDASVRWGVFWALTLCHGLHVSIGVLWLAAVGLARLRVDPDAPAGPVDYGVLYLHFVDAVWLLLLVLLYVLR